MPKGNRKYRRRRRASDPGPRRSNLSKYEERLARFRKLREYKASQEIDDPDLSGQEKAALLRVLKVDMNVKENTKNHHTDEYDIADGTAYNDTEMLLVRRGQEFTFRIKFNRQFDQAHDDLRLIFEFGEDPEPTKGSRVNFKLSAKDLPGEWGAWVSNVRGQWSTITVRTPPTCPVAKWRLRIDVVKAKDNKTTVYSYTCEDHFYILFNPWNKDDQVYIDHAVEEYVLNEKGCLFRGNQDQISSCPWNFGQFSEIVLPCVMYLLDEVSSIPDSSRGDPIKVVRQLSSLINGCDNEGVLQGNWSGEYSGGTAPNALTGSASIYSEYYRTKKTVKFGQCWVFSGLLTTACRALGMPVRSVTNFSSAHDTDESCSIDKHFDCYFEEISSGDSIWNFHVWNEVWMRRPDLPEKHRESGWQVVDATPQETSDGMYCMGPSAVSTILSGEVYLPFDTKFAFSEVNADVVYWMTDWSGEVSVIHKKESSVGKNISTKKPGCYEREDITHQYKHKEGSTEERGAVRRANMYSSKKETIYENKGGDVQFSLTYNNNTFVGQAIKAELKITNTSGSTRNVTGSLKVETTYNTGASYRNIVDPQEIKLALKGFEEKCITLEAPVEKYFDKLNDDCYIRFVVFGQVKKTGQIHTASDDRRLRKPHLSINVPKKAPVGTKFKAVVSFVNPLHIPLRNCKLVVEGPGLQEPVTMKEKDLKVKETFTEELEFTPVKAGGKQIVVSYNSDELTGVNVTEDVEVVRK